MDYNYDYYDDESQNPLYNTAKQFLLPDEQLLWIGKPGDSAKPHRSVFVLIFSLFWFGFALFWTVSATIAGGFFGLFGLPFIAFGIAFVYNVFWGYKKKYKNTVYVVTDRRALIIYQSRNGANCNEFNYSKLKNIDLYDVKGNIGTIKLENAYFDGYDTYSRRGYRYYGQRGNIAPSEFETCFVQIENVHEVYRIISEHMVQN